jgi:hypothetical protein
MIKEIIKSIEARRKWNRTKRFMKETATSRLIVSLITSGALTVPKPRRARA